MDGRYDLPEGFKHAASALLDRGGHDGVTEWTLDGCKARLLVMQDVDGRRRPVEYELEDGDWVDKGVM